MKIHINPTQIRKAAILLKERGEEYDARNARTFHELADKPLDEWCDTSVIALIEALQHYKILSDDGRLLV